MKVSVVGVGKVGSTLAYILSMQRTVRELVLVGREPESALGEVMDLEHAQALAPVPTRITAGSVEDTAGSHVVALCASVPMTPGMDDRLTLGPDNVALFQTLVPPLAAASPDAVFVVVSNPVDVLTYYTLKFSSFPPSRVLGTGTLVDSARFRRLLSDELDIHPDDLRAYILGEHGNSQFPAMSTAVAGGEPIDDTPHRRRLFQQTVAAGYEVFRRKGHTSWAIATAAASIVETIALDERHTLPLSVLVDGFHGVRDVCLSLPVVVGKSGVQRILHPELSPDEIIQFHHSASTVRQAIANSNA